MLWTFDIVDVYDGFAARIDLYKDAKFNFIRLNIFHNDSYQIKFKIICNRNGFGAKTTTKAIWLSWVNNWIKRKHFKKHLKCWKVAGSGDDAPNIRYHYTCIVYIWKLKINTPQVVSTCVLCHLIKWAKDGKRRNFGFCYLKLRCWYEMPTYFTHSRSYFN